MHNPLKNTFSGKKVLITGNTGFKGAWLTLMLNSLNADVYGFSDCIPWPKSILSKSWVKNEIVQFWGKIQNLENFYNVYNSVKPDFLFHLAAQPLVKTSIRDPWNTFQVNAQGTVNVLETLRKVDSSCVGLIVTTDKVYKNTEKGNFFKENDPLEGREPYSISKVCAEYSVDAYEKLFNKNINIVRARAGNVIGGGDWSKDRIIPDLVRAIERNEKVKIRNPLSVRPWLHVLDVCTGYLDLAQYIFYNKKNKSKKYNFAPSADNFLNVTDLSLKFCKEFKKLDVPVFLKNQRNPYESKLLFLDASMAKEDFGWEPYYNSCQAIKKTAYWYKELLNHKQPIEISMDQLNTYFLETNRNQISESLDLVG